MSNHYLNILTYHKITWIEEKEMDIFTAVVHSGEQNIKKNMVVMKNIEMIEFLLVDLKYEWCDYYAVYLKNFMEEERMKTRDFLQLVRADQWLYAYRLAVLTDNVSDLEYLCMFNYDLMVYARLCYLFWAFGHSTILSKEVCGY